MEALTPVRTGRREIEVRATAGGSDGRRREVDKVAVAPRHAGRFPGTAALSPPARGERRRERQDAAGRGRPPASSRPRSRGTWPGGVASAAPALPRAAGKDCRRVRGFRAVDVTALARRGGPPGAELRAAPRPLRRGAAPA